VSRSEDVGSTFHDLDEGGSRGGVVFGLGVFFSAFEEVPIVFSLRMRMMVLVMGIVGVGMGEGEEGGGVADRGGFVFVVMVVVIVVVVVVVIVVVVVVVVIVVVVVVVDRSGRFGMMLAIGRSLSAGVVVHDQSAIARRRQCRGGSGRRRGRGRTMEGAGLGGHDAPLFVL